MINKVKATFASLENQTKKIIKNGVLFCFVLCLLSLAILLIYDFYLENPYLYDIGLVLFKMSLLFASEFFICGIVVDSLKKNLI